MYEVSSKKIAVIVIAGFLGFLALIGALMAVNVVGQNEGMIITQSLTGKIRDSGKPGLKWHTPLFESTMKYPKHQIGFKSQQQGNTNDNVQTTFNIRVLYKIQDGVFVYKNTGSLDEEAIKSRIETYVSKSVDKVSNTRSYTDIRSNVSTVSNEITKTAKDLVSKNIPGLNVDQVVIDNIDAPDTIDNAIAEKQAQKQKADASAYEKEKAKNEAEAQEIKKSVGQDQQKIEICAKNPQSLACLPEGVQVVGAGVVSNKN